MFASRRMPETMKINHGTLMTRITQINTDSFIREHQCHPRYPRSI